MPAGEGALLELSQRLLDLLDPEAIARAALATIREHLRPDAISVSVADSAGLYLERLAGWGWSEAYVGMRNPLSPSDRSASAWAVHTRAPVAMDHTRKRVPFPISPRAAAAGVKASLRVPMLVGQRTVGVLSLSSLTPRTFSEDEIRFLSLVGNQTAIALERARERAGAREAEARYRSLVEHVPIGMFRTTPDGRILDANPTLVQLMGFPHLEAYIAAGAASPYVDTDARGRLQDLLEREGVVPDFETQFRRLDGTVFWGRVNAQAVRDEGGEIQFYEGTLEDVTERKRVEQALRESEERFRWAFEDAPIGMAIAGPDHRFVRVDRALCDMLGYAEEELVGRTFMDITHPEDVEREVQLAQRLFAGELPRYNIEKRYVTKIGDVVWARLTAVVIRDLPGRPLQGLAMIENITDRKQAEERIGQLAAIVESSNDAIIGATLEGVVTSWNAAAVRMYAYAEDEIKGRPVSILAPPGRAGEVAEILRKVGRGEVVTELETVRVRKDGTTVDVSLTVSPIRDADGRIVGASGIARDITDRRRIEASLQEANERLMGWVRDLERHTRDITLLGRMGELLQTCLTADEAFGVAAKTLPQIFPSRAGALCMLGDSRDVVEAVATWGEVATERIFAPDACWALRRGRQHLVEDPRSGLPCSHVRREVGGGYLCVPMMAQGEALGVLYLQDGAAESGRPGEADETLASVQQLATTVAEHVALAIANLRLRETLRVQSIRDPLTGLFNRRYLEETLEREVRRSARSQRPLGVIMLDLDHFKQFNDTFGHAAGDALLRELGGLLMRHIRDADIACRYGGEEFTLILPEASLEITRQRAERLREEIRHLHVRHRGQGLGGLTLSLGVAIYPEHGTTVEAILRAADAGLYQAKAQGRDCVVVAEVLPS